MCGIIAVVQRPARREAPEGAWLRERLGLARAALLTQGEIGRSAAAIEELDAALRGTPGVRALLADPSLTKEIDAGIAERKTYDRQFDGPYFKVSVGFGG